VKKTLPEFMAGLTPEKPIGFVSIDVDLYSSTRDTLPLFLGEPDLCLPVTLAYFDDTHGAPDRIGSLFRNRWCGQLRAIDEFNETNSMRKIERILTLSHRRPLDREMWLEQIYGVHMLDHPMRQTGAQRDVPSLGDHSTDTRMRWPL
jgi:hypothetical protein